MTNNTLHSATVGFIALELRLVLETEPSKRLLPLLAEWRALPGVSGKYIHVYHFPNRCMEGDSKRQALPIVSRANDQRCRKALVAMIIRVYYAAHIFSSVQSFTSDTGSIPKTESVTGLAELRSHLACRLPDVHKYQSDCKDHCETKQLRTQVSHQTYC